MFKRSIVFAVGLLTVVTASAAPRILSCDITGYDVVRDGGGPVQRNGAMSKKASLLIEDSGVKIHMDPYVVHVAGAMETTATHYQVGVYPSFDNPRSAPRQTRLMIDRVAGSANLYTQSWATDLSTRFDQRSTYTFENCVATTTKF